LRKINLSVISNDVTGNTLANLTESDSAKLTDFLRSATASTRDAIPAPGTFPLVIYVQGYGSSLQDNSTLCESLASKGSVVLGSAYQDESGHMIAGRDASANDIRFLVQCARNMPKVEFSRIALVGHGGGAQTSLLYASQEGSIVDAVVSLDTTQDDYFSDKALFRNYLDRIRPENLEVPILAAPNQGAIYEFLDSCRNAVRTYLTVDKLGHEGFTSE
jgi:dienelactone hydrolase